MSQLAFSLDANRCTGCKACVVACKDVNNLPVGYKLRRVVTAEAGTWETDAASGLLQPVGVFSYSLSYSCMQCASPACMAACPKGAVQKDGSGVVFIDQGLCIGCGRCAKACPWDAPVVVPAIDGDRKARKCDFCRDLLAKGEEPACVAACLMRCLEAVELDAAGPDGPGPECRFGDAMLADAPQLGPHFLLARHRRAAKAPIDAVRVHSMPEEWQNG